jgi:hypothetical protein
VPSARIAFAGLTSLCEDIMRSALRERPDIEFVSPWTQLPSLTGNHRSRTPELLFVELVGTSLPHALRLLLAAAEPLKIVALSPDARQATLFSIKETRTILFEHSPAELWRAASGAR